MPKRIEHCAQHIAEEQRLADQAASSEERAAHLQLALLYQTQFNILSRQLERASTE